MRRNTRLLTVGVLSTTFVLAGCGDDSGSNKSSSPTSSSAATSSAAKPLTVSPDKVTPMTAIKVDEKNPKAPKLTLATKPFQANQTTARVVKKGSGAAVKATDIAYVNYLAVNGTNGKELFSTYGKDDVAVVLNDKSQFPGFVKALTGKPVGTVMDVAIPPADGFGAQGSQQLGITAKDTLIFRMTITGASAVLDKPEGTTVAPKKELPAVAVSDGNQSKKPATITMPKSGGKVATAPKSLVSQDLITGKGRKVVEGQTVKVRYTGVVWGTGKVFDSSAKNGGAPADFPLQTASATNPQGLLPGFVKGLVGKPVGSRVLLVLPPAEGYGAQGQPAAGIKGTDTLVFVVDILAAL